MIHDVSLRSISNSSSECLSDVALAIIIEDKNKLNFSDQCQTKFLLLKSQNEFYDLLTIPSCTSSTKTKAKGMENMLIFHVTLRIQILTMFSVQSKYSNKTINILLLGFVISNKRAEHETCKYNVNTTVELTIKVKIKFTPSNAEKTKWIHLTTDVGHLLTDIMFSHQLQKCLLMGTVPKTVHLESCQVCGQLWFSSALANCLRGLEDYVVHLCVVKSVHLAFR